MSKFENAPRVQRRSAERELKDDFKIFHKFSDNQVEVVNRMVAYVANELAKERIDEIMDSINRCIITYFNIRFEDMSEKEIEKEFSILDSLLEEDSRKIELLIKECGGNKEMARKNMAVYETEVRKECESLVANGISQGEATKYLKDKFKDNKVPTTILVNIFKKVKAEKEIKDTDPEVVAAAEYIFPEIKEDDEKKDKHEPQKQAIEGKKVDTKVNTPNEVENPVQAKSKLNKSNLKTIKKVVQGEFAEYTKGLNGVEVEGKIYKDVKEVDAEAKSLGFEQETNIKKYEADMKELENKISICKGNIRKIEIMAEEIKAVMIMSMA